MKYFKKSKFLGAVVGKNLEKHSWVLNELWADLVIFFKILESPAGKKKNISKLRETKILQNVKIFSRGRGKKCRKKFVSTW